jgi:hypothetical protein
MRPKDSEGLKVSYLFITTFKTTTFIPRFSREK